MNKLGTFVDWEDNSIKTVFENEEGKILEMTLLQNRQDRDVVCVPTHYFCTLGCKMCHLTSFMSNKKMSKIGITEFNEALYKTLCLPAGVDSGELIRRTYKKKLLISFMGIGEPTLNSELIGEVLRSDYSSLGYEEVIFALSTMMPKMENFERTVEVIRKYSNGRRFKIHFSLHSPISSERKKIIPASEVSVQDACKELVKYRETTENKVEIHYTLISGVNDGDLELGEMDRILKEYGIPIKFLNFNEVGDLKKSEREEDWIKTFFPDRGCKLYSPPGKQIGSSCGQFTRHYFVSTETEDEKREFEQWKKDHEVFDRFI